MEAPTTVLECLQRNTGRYHDAYEIATVLTPPEQHKQYPHVLAQVHAELALLLKAKKIEEGRWRDYEHTVYTVKGK